MKLARITSVIAGVASSVIVSCAKPTYLTRDENNRQKSQSTTACAAKFYRSGNCVDITWETHPTESAVGSFLYKVSRENIADRSPVVVDTQGTPIVVLWMPSMGHGSSPVTVARVDTGTYRASEVFFIMPGKWQIKFQMTNGNEILDEAILDLTF
jgi:hypothetical protein